MAEIHTLQPSDYDPVVALWQRTEGLTLRAADSHEGFTRYPERNPGLSFVARDQHTVVGAILGGTMAAVAIFTTLPWLQVTAGTASGERWWSTYSRLSCPMASASVT